MAMGGAAALVTSTTVTAPAHDFEPCRERPTPLSSPFDGVNSQHQSLTSPLQGLPLPRSRHSADVGGDDLSLAGNTVGSLPSESTPTRCSAGPLRSRQALLNAQSLSSTIALERHSFSDWYATAAWDDPSTGSCPSSSSWSLLNQPQPRNAARTMASSPISTVDTVATTLFIDGLPAFIENKWQLQPYVPPQGVVALRVKSSRGRNVGFAVYDSIAAARDALTWFKQMLIIKEVVQTSTFGAPPAAESARGTEVPPVLASGDCSAPPAGGTSACFPGSPVESEPTPLEYEEYLCTQPVPGQFASLLRRCTLLRAEWARSLETQHPPANVAAAAAASSVASSPLSYPTSPWGTAAAVIRPPRPPPMVTAVPHVGRGPSHDVGDSYSQVSEVARQAPTPQAHPHHPLPSPIAWSPGSQSPQQPPHPCATVGCADAQATHPPVHNPSFPSTPYHTPSPLTRRVWASSAPSAPLERPEVRCYYSCSAAQKASHQHAHSTTCQPPFSAHWGSHMTKRSDAREGMDAWRGAPPEPPALSHRQESRPQPHHGSYRHHQYSSEPPLPSRTLFVRLIHNFDAPGYLQQDQVHSSAGSSARSSTGSANAMPMKPLTTVRLPPTVAGSVTAPGTTTGYAEEAAPPTPTPLVSQTTPSLHVSPASGAKGTRPVVSAVPHHHHHMYYQSPSSPSLTTTPQLRSPLDSRGLQAYSSSQPPPSSQLMGPCADRHGGGAGAADEALSRTTPNAEDREFFRFAQSVLREEYFSEKFAGFLRYREFLRPPYYGGCFVLFERGEDMQRCLQWMRKDERLMKLFAVAPARNDSFGP
ncbi:conserved hypothetical protein [Leishmania mexicana MHOM/GT/2001/U1103]|uniref:RRM domain-containing protein n=1 Tax=Leishmania mexicana (strain MHOM/GT/2001/U1103) TaxID=929439 RepID=E9ANP8_LEIMU|nr:conserved hypothetical protein [Leishmania mexicana MHOM/GT/2001/U1103]CBZ24559.1 conserved hypothetical protein [Leishmania mexicana MHOM/GT/2001/U1103]